MEYNFMYNDGKYFVLDLTERDVAELTRQLCLLEKPFIKLSKGIVATSGLRFAVERVSEEAELKSETPPEYAWEELLDKQKRRNFDDDDDLDEGDAD